MSHLRLFNKHNKWDGNVNDNDDEDYYYYYYYKKNNNNYNSNKIPGTIIIETTLIK